MDLFILSIIQWMLIWTGACSDTNSNPIQESQRLEILASYADSTTVVDLAGVLTEEERNELILLLDGYKAENGLEFGLYTVPELGNIGIQELSLAVSGKMNVGTEGLNNGAIIFLSVLERQIKIEINYGLEWEITTLHAAQILDEIRPLLKGGNYYQAFTSAFEKMHHMGSQASWMVSYPDFMSFQKDKKNAMGKILRFKARGKTRDYNNVPLSTQFSEDLFIHVRPENADSVRLNFSNYMVEMANTIVYGDQAPHIFARVVSVEPLQLNLLGILP